MYSKREEFYNVITHLPGIVLAIAALIILLLGDQGKSPYSVWAITLYSISLFFLYLASTLYHAVSHVRWKNMLRKLDHIGIYLLIAGTYTPVTLISLVNRNGWLLFWIVWGMALLGTLLKMYFTGKYEKLSLWLYLAMGWLIIFDVRDVIELQSSLGLLLLAVGGLLYTLGTVFYVLEKIPYNHAIWHCFVLGGSVSHFLFIYLDVI